MLNRPYLPTYYVGKHLCLGAKTNAPQVDLAIGTEATSYLSIISAYLPVQTFKLPWVARTHNWSGSWARKKTHIH